MTLHMVQIRPDARALAGFAHRAGLPHQDQGYILHRALRDGFGEIGPQPFRWVEPEDSARQDARHLGDPGKAQLLGYTLAGAVELRDALALALPDVAAIFHDLRARAMPERFAPGRILRFETRICPIVRTARDQGEGRPKRELDAFVHATLGRPKEEMIDREPIYRTWLAQRLAEGGAELIDAGMRAFTLAGLARRSHASPKGGGPAQDGPARRLLAVHPRRAARRPDATFQGSLRVTDPARFAHLLARGIGRHRAFGFGMLLLRP